MAEQNIVLSLRIPKDLKKRLERAAKDDDRTVTSFVIHAIQNALKGAGK